MSFLFPIRLCNVGRYSAENVRRTSVLSRRRRGQTAIHSKAGNSYQSLLNRLSVTSSSTAMHIRGCIAPSALRTAVRARTSRILDTLVCLILSYVYAFIVLIPNSLSVTSSSTAMHIRGYIAPSALRTAVRAQDRRPREDCRSCEDFVVESII